MYPDYLCIKITSRFPNRVDDVAEGFIQLLNDEDKVGEAMKISIKNGIEYHTFPPDPISI